MGLRGLLPVDAGKVERLAGGLIAGDGEGGVLQDVEGVQVAGGGEQAIPQASRVGDQRRGRSRGVAQEQSGEEEHKALRGPHLADDSTARR